MDAITQKNAVAHMLSLICSHAKKGFYWCQATVDVGVAVKTGDTMLIMVLDTGKAVYLSGPFKYQEVESVGYYRAIRLHEPEFHFFEPIFDPKPTVKVLTL